MLQPTLVSMVQIGQAPRPLVRLNEADHVADRRPGSAWAKYMRPLYARSRWLLAARDSSSRAPVIRAASSPGHTRDAHKHRSEPGEPNRAGSPPVNVELDADTLETPNRTIKTIERIQTQANPPQPKRSRLFPR